MTMTAAATVDAHAGYCANCRAHNCTLCASDRCACPDRRRHRNRPSYAGRAEQVGAELSRPKAPMGTSTAGRAPSRVRPVPSQAVWELHRAEPPAPPPARSNLAEKARPLLEEIAAADSHEWYRLAIWPSTRGAGQARGRLRKAFGREWEWRAVRLVEQSALYVRLIGTERRAPLD